MEGPWTLSWKVINQWAVNCLRTNETTKKDDWILIVPLKWNHAVGELKNINFKFWTSLIKICLTRRRTLLILISVLIIQYKDHTRGTRRSAFENNGWANEIIYHGGQAAFTEKTKLVCAALLDIHNEDVSTAPELMWPGARLHKSLQLRLLWCDSTYGCQVHWLVYSLGMSLAGRVKYC